MLSSSEYSSFHCSVSVSFSYSLPVFTSKDKLSFLSGNISAPQQNFKPVLFPSRGARYAQSTFTTVGSLQCNVSSRKVFFCGCSPEYSTVF